MPPPQPVDHPELAQESQRQVRGRDFDPLLTLPEQRRSRQSIPGSLTVEPSAGGAGSSRTSIALPKDRRSLLTEQSPVSPSFPPDEAFEVPPPTAKARGKRRAADQGETRAPPTIPGPATYIPRRPEAPMAPPGEFHSAPAQLLDVEAQRTQQIKRSTSRASLPQSAQQQQQPSTSGQIDPAERSPSDADAPGGDDDNGDDEDYSWGPQHPCFPHPNPHVPLSSPLFQSTRIIRIKRDWMVAGDLAPTFANLFPEVLDPYVSEEAFRTIVRKVNAELVAAFSPFTARAWVDAVMGVATGWLWDDLGLSGVKARLKALEQWIEDWNRGEGAKEGVQIIPLRRTGYMTVSLDRLASNHH